MVANIFDQRFLDRTGPAWHSLGKWGLEMGAVEALNEIGIYYVETRPLITILPDGTHLPLKDQVIMRHPTPEDKNWVPYGMVGPDYQLVNPSTFASIYDKVIGKPVETIGALGKGETLFISTHLPSFDVKGDEFKNYLLLVSPMDGNHAVVIRDTPVRVVCQNTLIAAAGAAVETFVIRHNTNVLTNLEIWMMDMWSRAEQKATIIRNSLTKLANYYPKKQQVYEVLDRAYPIQDLIRLNAPDDILIKRQERAVDRNRAIVERKEACISLFEGGGTGMDTLAARGTMYGLIQAVVETEQYRKGNDRLAMDRETVFGKRGMVMGRAYEQAMQIVGN